MIAPLVFWTLVVLLATGVLWYGSHLLEGASENLSAHYELPDIVQGSMVVAVGSSFPELSTATVATFLHGNFELGTSAIVGSAIFNILAIPALAGLVTVDPLRSNERLVYKEAQFYIIAIAVLVLTFSFAVIYFPVPDDSGVIKGTLTRPLALLPMAIYGLYIFIQYQDTMDYEPETASASVGPWKEWGILAVSLGIILGSVELLVRSAIRFGELFGTPSFLWGISVLAAATSLPDAFVSVQKARAGKAVTSLANVLGSNVFDLLICIPAGVMVAGSVTVNYSVAAPMFGALTLATIVLFAFIRTNLVLSQGEAIVLLLCYLAFLVWMGGENFGMLDWIRSLPPPTA